MMKNNEWGEYINLLYTLVVSSPLVMNAMVLSYYHWWYSSY